MPARTGWSPARSVDRVRGWAGGGVRAGHASGPDGSPAVGAAWAGRASILRPCAWSYAPRLPTAGARNAENHVLASRVWLARSGAGQPASSVRLHGSSPSAFRACTGGSGASSSAHARRRRVPVLYWLLWSISPSSRRLAWNALLARRNSA